MTVTVSGCVVVDLTAPEGVGTAGDLSVGEAVYNVLWQAVTDVDDTLPVELWIGDARRVFWIDPRAFDLLAQASSVSISGSDCRGVEDAARGLRQALGENAA